MSHRREPSAKGPGRLARRLYWQWVAAVVTLLIAAGAVPVRLFHLPPTGAPASADAIVVLAGDGRRLAAGLELAHVGVSNVLVISNGEEQGWVLANRLCREPEELTVICFVPRPGSTAGEARAIGQMAQRRGWNTLVVVTSRSHVTRARTLMDQCVEGEIHMVAADDRAVPASRVLQAITRETAGLAAAVTIGRAC